VNKKAKIIVKDNKMCTPVHYAASGADYRTLEILLKSANTVNDKDSTGKTALFYSIYNTSE
jgi:ankyrin repeat protein